MTRVVDISAPAYLALLKQSGDECGTTLLAGRSIATPFVGAFAGALMCGLAASDREQDRAQSAWAFDLATSNPTFSTRRCFRGTRVFRRVQVLDL